MLSTNEHTITVSIGNIAQRLKCSQSAPFLNSEICDSPYSENPEVIPFHPNSSADWKFPFHL